MRCSPNSKQDKFTKLGFSDPGTFADSASRLMRRINELLMSDPVMISLITMIGSVIGAGIALLNTVLARKTTQHVEEVKTNVAVTQQQVNQLEKNTNGMKDELIKKTAENAYAKGQKNGIQETIDKFKNGEFLT